MKRTTLISGIKRKHPSKIKVEDMKKRLSLEIFDPTGVIVCTHHFDYDAGRVNRLVLTMEGGKQLLDHTGKDKNQSRTNILKQVKDK